MLVLKFIQYRKEYLSRSFASFQKMSAKNCIRANLEVSLAAGDRSQCINWSDDRLKSMKSMH
eukprot:scaffold880_cov132-Cylindrotheca_fusiformis.AAC.27